MKSPCHECLERTAIPNCHAACERYKVYAAYRERIRAKRAEELSNQCAEIANIIKRNTFYNKHRRK